MKHKNWKRVLASALCGVRLLGLTACVNQYPDESSAGEEKQSTTESTSTSQYLVEGSTALAKAPENPRIVATSARYL